MEIQTVVFDLDDTLFAEEEFALSGYAAVHDWQLKHFGLDGFLQAALEIYKSGKRERLFNQVLDRFGAGYDAGTVAEMVRVFREHIPRIHLHKDAEWILGHLRDAKKNIAVITDGFEISQENKIKALGLAHRVDTIICTDSLGGRPFWKPNPTAFKKIMERFPGDGGAFMYVGDNPIKDFIAPRSLGWATVHVERPGGVYRFAEAPLEHQAHHRIQSLLQLPPLLA